MADVSVKMGISGISQFRQGMNDAQASVKTFDAALKANEKQLKATGNAENYLQAQASILTGKLEAQRNAAKNAEQALRLMEQNGVKTTSASYQNMQRKLIEAQTGIMDTQEAINNLGTSTADTTGKVDKLETSLTGLNRKVSLEQVRSAIGSITNGMERAAKKAGDMAQAVWDAVMESAGRADDTATQAMMLNMGVEDYQRYKKVFDTVGEITVQEWQKAKQKVQKLINDPSQEQVDILTALGVRTDYGQQGKYGYVKGKAKEFETVFWEIGQKLREDVASGKITQDMADTYANAIFGKSFSSLNPMFALGKEGFAKALEEQNVVTEEFVNKLATLNDTVIKLQGDFKSLQDEILAGMAPALTKAAEVLDSLLGNIMDYLQTPEGQAALKSMEDAVSGLFEDLEKIDPQDVVSGFTDVFNTIVEGLKWLDENKDTVGAALGGIVTTWGTLKLAGGALDVLKLVNGLKELIGTGTGAASAAGSAAGTAWGSGFAAAVMKAAPWLAGLYTMLNPAESASNDQDVLFDEKAGKMTSAGWEDFIKNPQNWADTMAEIGQIFGDMGRIATDENAINAMAKYRMSGDLDVLIQEMEALGYIQKIKDEETNGSGVPETVSTQEGPGGIIYQYDAEGNKIGTTFPTAGAAEGGGVAAEEIVNSLGEGGEITIPVKLEIDETEQDLQGMADEEVTEPVEIPSITELPADMQQQLQEHIDGWGPFKIYITPVIGEPQGSLVPGHANGLPYVPFDGYAAILHKGERVVPANQNGGSRSFSSNLYVESMYMNNGTDAEGLASAIAAANRRTMSGYGS